MTLDHPYALLGTWPEWLRSVKEHLSAALNTFCQSLHFETFSPFMITRLVLLLSQIIIVHALNKSLSW